MQSVLLVVQSLSVNTELASEVPVALWEIQGHVPVNLYSHIFISQSVPNLTLYMFLFKGTYYMLSAINPEPRGNRTLTQAWQN